MPECLGIDIGSEAVALSVVSASKAGLCVSWFERRGYPEEILDAAGKAAFAARLALDSGHSRLPIAVSLPGTDVFLRLLTVPFTRKTHIARTLKFELEGLLLFDVETAVIDFAVTGAADGATKLLVAAIRQDALDAAASPFESAGLRVESVTADVLSAAALRKGLGLGDYAILDIGPASWKLSLCAGGRLVFSRAAPASPSSAGPETAVGAWYKQSIMAAPGGASPEKVFLAGAGSVALDLNRLQAAAGVPIERASLPPAMFSETAAGRGDEIARLGLSSVCAAASSALGDGILNFYAAARGRQGMLERLFGPAAVGLALVTLLAAAYGVGWRREARESRAAADEVVAAEMRLWKEVFPDREPAGGVNAALASAVRQLQTNASSDSAGGRAVDVLKAWHVITATAPRNQAVTFSRFDVRRDRIDITVAAGDATYGSALVSAVSREGTFRARVKNSKSENNQWTFEILMEPAR